MMTAKDYVSIIGMPLLCLGITIGVPHIYREQDQTAAYKKELLDKLEEEKKERQQEQKEFQEYKLETQEKLGEITRELSLYFVKINNLQNADENTKKQYEYVDSHYKLADDVLERKIERLESKIEKLQRNARK